MAARIAEFDREELVKSFRRFIGGIIAFQFYSRATRDGGATLKMRVYADFQFYSRATRWEPCGIDHLNSFFTSYFLFKLISFSVF